mmetsp:Transcript_104398/g.294305  ORF Transcript_104398/g.294305 Transcript_104398/m.294305 type:complete len:338 (-) Transcript_104398:69-1082(-)
MRFLRFAAIVAIAPLALCTQLPQDEIVSVLPDVDADASYDVVREQALLLQLRSDTDGPNLSSTGPIVLRQENAAADAANQTAKGPLGVLKSIFGWGSGGGGSNDDAPTANLPTGLDKVHMEIHYEVLCPYCIQFFSGNFITIWNDTQFRNRLDIKLYPFGNGVVIPEKQVSEGYHFFHPTATYPLFQCQHGEAECIGNMIQACAMDLEPFEQSVQLVICMASYGTSMGPELTSYECGTKMGFNMSAIRDCVYSDHGAKLMTAIAEKAMDPYLNRTGVPWLTVEGMHLSEAEGGDGVVQSICGMLASPLPASCQKYSSGASVKESGGCGGPESGGSTC